VRPSLDPVADSHNPPSPPLSGDRDTAAGLRAAINRRPETDQRAWPV